MSKTKIDMNADLGESFGHYTIGDDASLLDVVTSANVACGFHGGDHTVMAQTFKIAREKNVSVGAHPGYPDLWGFGRRIIPFSAKEIETLVAYQIGAAQALARYSGHKITYVKTHGALGNLSEKDENVAKAVIRAIEGVDPTLALVSGAVGVLGERARERGLTVFSEIFADRAYTEEGLLVSRAEPGAVLHDVELIADRVIRMVKAGAIETVSGAMLPTAMDTICVHGDNAESLAVARTVKNRLQEAGIAVEAFL
ncbi:LamB/YcsF family protein [Neokomagataea thailandica NBRC 106555]|uniref:5-oxoprolinase subunit A n=2 Tax=Neokomagataea TaxID=1223423 RepID=A0A4Y6V573_9PROT|nr:MULTISPECIES: 5-oxoprolinase subunit PxpA [Neokomagataea]QDH25252.1 LamB/YcsF family protein [Neokomagataea tanensis]GBR54303.1 LamB/YcsF family protein [Neokomagataea thailandica NBRC 106555]